jgi:flagellar hook-associated protein 3 FlgL
MSRNAALGSIEGQAMDLSFYTDFSTNIAQQEAQIALLQQQVSTGFAVQTPDQNPAAYEAATLGNDQVSALASDTITQATIQSQLGSVSNVYQSVASLYDNVQSVIEQSLNATTNTSDLQSLATEISAASQQLVGLGNTTGVNGTYLFGGSRGNVAPFQTGADGGIQYMGDGGQTQAEVGPGTSAATGANGDVFVAGLSGDGTASVTAATANTGTAVLLSEGVYNPSAAASFQSGNAPIVLSFTTGASGLTYTATQGGSTLQTGAVTSGMTLQLAGSGYQLTGAPAAGDSFTLTPSRPQTAFSLLQSVAAALSGGSSTPAQAAQLRQQLNNSLSGLAQYQQVVLTAQAQTGVTLQAVNNAAANNAAQQTAAQASVQNAVGANMPATITALDQTLTSVQAAMKAFGTAQGLSLFNYI